MPLSLTSKYHFFKNRMESEVFMRSALKGLMHINKAYMNQIKSVPVKNMRRHMEYFFKFRQQHPMVSRSVLNCGHVPLDILTPPGCMSASAIIYFHGGGYIIGSRNTHRRLAAKIALESKMQVILPEYRLAPEHPFPAAVEDGVKIWEWARSRGFSEKNLILAGDSAGGGLSLAVMHALRDRNLGSPASVICLSPWADLTGTSDWYGKNAKKDLIVTQNVIRLLPKLYLQGQTTPLNHPLVSPVFGSFKGCPPVYIQVGSSEILMGDALLLAEKIRSDEGDVQVDVWDHMQHVWQIFADVLPEGRDAIKKIGIWAGQKVSKKA